MAKYRRLGGQHELVPDVGRGEGPADPHARREGLGEGSEVYDAMRVVGAKSPPGISGKAQQPIRVVLDDRQPGRSADMENPAAPGPRKRDASRAVEVRHGEEELRGPARRGQPANGFLQ